MPSLTFRESDGGDSRGRRAIFQVLPEGGWFIGTAAAFVVGVDGVGSGVRIEVQDGS